MRSINGEKYFRYLLLAALIISYVWYFGLGIAHTEKSLRISFEFFFWSSIGWFILVTILLFIYLIKYPRARLWGKQPDSQQSVGHDDLGLNID